MPGVTGFELATALAADPVVAGVPMVLLTSSEDDRDMGPVPLAGIYDRLTKPVRRVQGVGTLTPDATRGNPKVAPFRRRPTCRYIASACSPCAALNSPSQEWVAGGLLGLLVFTTRRPWWSCQPEAP